MEAGQGEDAAEPRERRAPRKARWTASMAAGYVLAGGYPTVALVAGSTIGGASPVTAAHSAMVAGSTIVTGSVIASNPAPAPNPAIAATAATNASTAYTSVRSYEGYAYAESSDHLLYRESHWLYTADGVGQHLIVYRCASGEPFGRKRVNTSSGPATPDFEMLDARNGYREGARTRDGHREVFNQADAQAPERRASVSLRDNTVIDAGIDAFVTTHWNALSETGISPLPFLVPSQLGYVDFTAKQQRDARKDDSDVRWFRFSLASWYAFAAPHLEFGYDIRTHELREYLGPSNIHGDGNKSLNVRIEFPQAERRTDVAPADVERAAATPLTGRCKFP